MPISPNKGSVYGLTPVTITGTNLSNVIAVNFGNKLAQIESNTDNKIQVISPPGFGVVDVYVTTTGGISNSIPFYYLSPPIVTSLSPKSGPITGGNIVIINGFNLTTTVSVIFGANSAVTTIINDGQISVVVPAGISPGEVPVIVTTNGGTTGGLKYTYLDAPTIETISPSSGSTLGGNVVTIKGSNLSTVFSVKFGDNFTSFGIVDQYTVTAIVPPGDSDTVDVLITTTGSQAALVDAYTYVVDPQI